MPIFKKIFIISTALLTAALFFWGIYSFSFKKDKSSEEIVQEEKRDSLFDFSKDKKEKIFSITDEPVISPVLQKESGLLFYYSKENGNALRLNTENKEKKILSSDTLAGLREVFWSPKMDKVISHLYQNGESKFFLYDYDSRTGKQLKSGMDNVVWTNLGDKIIYKYYDLKTKKRSLNISDPDGNNWNELADLDHKNMKITHIPSSSKIAFWNFPNAFEETDLSVISLVGGERKKIFLGKFGADYLWSPNGDKVLISSTDTKGGSRLNFGVINSNGGEYMNLNLPTLVSKCIWSLNNVVIYCALPGSIPETAVMPNDYYEEKFLTKDTFWKINIADGGKKERIIELEDLIALNMNFDAVNLLLSEDEEELFFVNRYDNKIYQINL